MSKHTTLEFSRSAIHTSLFGRIVKLWGTLNEIQSVEKKGVIINGNIWTGSDKLAWIHTLADTVLGIASRIEQYYSAIAVSVRNDDLSIRCNSDGSWLTEMFYIISRLESLTENHSRNSGRWVLWFIRVINTAFKIDTAVCSVSLRQINILSNKAHFILFLSL